MRFFILLYWGIILILNLHQSLSAQIPDHLKNPYKDLLKLNNSGQYRAAVLQGKIMVAQEPEFPHAYGQLAFAFEKAERIEQGLAYFDSLRAQSPDNPYVYYAIALLEKGRKNHEQAAGNLKVCIKLDPKYEGAYYQLVNIYDALKDLETAADYLHTLLQEDSLNAAAHYGLGYIRNLKKEWAKGAEAFARSLELNSELVSAYYFLGLMHVFQRHHQKALEIWDKGKDVAANLNEIQWQARMTGNVGNVYLDMGKYDKAIPYQEKALKMAREIGDKSQEARHLSNLGNSYKATGKPDKAVELYDQGLAIARQIDDSRSEETLLGNKSAALADKAEYKKSIECATTALKMAEARGDSNYVAFHLWNIGVNYINQARYPEALRCYTRALGIKREQGDQRGICGILDKIGTIRKEMGEIHTAIDTLQKALQIARAIPSIRLEYAIIGSLGYAYSGLSEYTQAYNYLHRALTLADSLGEVLPLGTYLGDIGAIYKKWGNFTKALDYLNRALRQDGRISDLRAVVRHYINIANIHEIRGDYVKALELEKKALALSDSIGTRNYSAVSLGNTGVIYDKIGDTGEALSYFERALKLAREVPLREFESSILANIGSVYERMGEDTVALDYFNESLRAAEAIGNKEDQVEALIAIGDIHAQKKEYSKALNTYNLALALAKKIGQKNQEGRLYLNMGNVHLQQDNLSTALSFFRKALDIGKKMNAFDLVYESLGGFAAVEEKQKRYDEAINYYGQAIEKVESVRERLRIESYKTTFMESKFSIYESVITLLIRLDRFKDAYEYLQRFRARSFLDILSPQRLDFAEGISAERFEQSRFWELKLRETYEQLAGESNKGEGKRNAKLIAALEDSLQRIRNRHEKILDEIRLHHPRYAELTGMAQPLTLPEIQQKALQPDVPLVEYFVGPELSAVWVIKPDTFHCEVLEVKREELEAMVTQLRQPFREVKEEIILNLDDVKFDLKLAQRFYERIFQPVEKYLAENTRLIIVPDGILHYLPFEALVTGVEKGPHDRRIMFSFYEKAHYLVEKYAVTYLPAASMLAQERRICEEQGEMANQLLAFGSPDFGRFTQIKQKRESRYASLAKAINLRRGVDILLAPLASQDAREVSAIMQPSLLLVGKEATEKRFKAAASVYAHIYLSTHAIVDENQPMYSRIAFAQNDDPSEDGFLHTYEVFDLCLNADLVTLSACETGLGRLSRGEGLIGLTRAFLYSGTPSVLVSLWSVQESSAMVMKNFYQNLKDGMIKSEALRQAKLKLIHTREGGLSFAHPFLWAPFVLVGAGN